MEDNLIYIIPPAFIVFFGILWLLITQILKRAAKFGPMPVRAIDLGVETFRHTFGSASINWVNFNSLLTIVGYENGLLVKNMGLFGGGCHWIPRSEIKLSADKSGLWGKQAKFEYQGVKFKIRGASAADIHHEFSNPS